ncbi:hypothetical protein QOZ80_3BG0273360 [Eleusine coracana subsp. coracana]|nr:hypothetical protein QOZ80_3BG0273360 [Eleusine coracana subsp. coracana]
MSNKPRALKDLMTAVDAGHVIDSDKKLLAPRRSSYSRSRQSRLMVVVETPPDETSFEFSAMVSNSSASPASMVFSEGQLRAHQYPAVRSSAANSKGASPSMGSIKSSGAMGSKKRVSFATDKTAAMKAGGGQGKKSGGLLGCMSSACGSSRNEVVEPAKNANRKMVAAV